MPAIIVPRQTACEPSDAVPVRIWAADTLGADEGGEVARWLSDFLDTPCRLLREHPKAHRVASPDHVDSWIAKHNDWADGFPPEHQFGFADGFPFLMTNQASLDELNRQLGDKSAEPITINRFRPNIVVAGLEAYDEDYLTGMRTGELTFAFVKACARCPIPNIDPARAHAGKAPRLTLAAHSMLAGRIRFGGHPVLAGTSHTSLQRRTRCELCSNYSSQK